MDWASQARGQSVFVARVEQTMPDPLTTKRSAHSCCLYLHAFAASGEDVLIAPYKERPSLPPGGSTVTWFTAGRSSGVCRRRLPGGGGEEWFCLSLGVGQRDQSDQAAPRRWRGQ